MLLLAAASSMSACIIPVAPEFQDPPQDPPGLPYFISEDPPFYTLRTVPALPAVLNLSVSVGDTDPGVTLWYRWALDYPPFTTGTFAPPQEPVPPTGIAIKLDCTVNADPSLGPQHRLLLMVANQQFIVTSPPTLDTVADPTPGDVIEGSWQVNISCQAPTTSGGTP